VALVNADRYGVGDRMRFAAGDLFAALPMGACFDLIVSNPPYIRRDEIAALEPEVSRWEPRAALDGGADGLEFYRRIAAQALRYLDRRGVLLLEIGSGTGAMVKEIFQNAGGWNGLSIANDYAGRERILIAHKVVEVQQ
jgi:release factor glutamine methyltransferase